MQDEVQTVEAAADAATHRMAQVKAALTVQQQEFKRTSQMSASLKVRWLSVQPSGLTAEWYQLCTAPSEFLPVMCIELWQLI